MLDYRARARPVLQQRLTCVLPSEEEVVTPFSAAVNLSATELIDVHARCARCWRAPAKLTLDHLARPINSQRQPPPKETLDR